MNARPERPQHPPRHISEILAEAYLNAKGDVGPPLGEVVATWDGDLAQHEPFLVCCRCARKLCSVEEGDTFDVLLATVSDHVCNEGHEPAAAAGWP